jgi:hypothetical protein
MVISSFNHFTQNTVALKNNTSAGNNWCAARGVCRKFSNDPSAIKCHSIGTHLSLRESGLRSRHTDYVTAWITK